MKKLNSEEKKIACLIQGDIPLVKSPFEEMGVSCGIPAAEIINISQSFLEKRIMRKFGAILRHQKAGYRKNALVVWSVPAAQTEKKENMFASFSFYFSLLRKETGFERKI